MQTITTAAVRVVGHTLVVGAAQDTIMAGGKQIDFEVSFTTITLLKAGGSIEVKFPATFPNIYAHCRSAVSSGSTLVSAAGANIPHVGCRVQNTRSWVITGFADLSPGVVKIQGLVDLPTAAGTSGSIEVHTYADQHLTNINANGLRIDKIVAGLTVTTIANNRMNIELDGFTTVKRDVLRAAANTVAPFKTVIQLTNTLTANTNTIQLFFPVYHAF